MFSTSIISTFLFVTTPTAQAAETQRSDCYLSLISSMPGTKYSYAEGEVGYQITAHISGDTNISYRGLVDRVVRDPELAARLGIFVRRAQTESGHTQITHPDGPEFNHRLEQNGFPFRAQPVDGAISELEFIALLAKRRPHIPYSYRGLTEHDISDHLSYGYTLFPAKLWTAVVRLAKFENRVIKRLNSEQVEYLENSVGFPELISSPSMMLDYEYLSRFFFSSAKWADEASGFFNGIDDADEVSVMLNELLFFTNSLRQHVEFQLSLLDKYLELSADGYEREVLEQVTALVREQLAKEKNADQPLLSEAFFRDPEELFADIEKRRRGEDVQY